VTPSPASIRLAYASGTPPLPVESLTHSRSHTSPDGDGSVDGEDLVAVVAAGGGCVGSTGQTDSTDGGADVPPDPAQAFTSNETRTNAMPRSIAHHLSGLSLVSMPTAR
jgi:hypothetical protein